MPSKTQTEATAPAPTEEEQEQQYRVVMSGVTVSGLSGGTAGRGEIHSASAFGDDLRRLLKMGAIEEYTEEIVDEETLPVEGSTPPPDTDPAAAQPATRVAQEIPGQPEAPVGGHSEQPIPAG